MAGQEPGVVRDFDSLDTEDKELIKEANKARDFAYCPYSKFAVGAALKTADNVTFRGCNIESCSFTPTICAERTAICKGVSEGHKKFKTVAVVAYQKNVFTAPCGVCRQTLAEFSEGDMDVLMSKTDMKKVLCVKLKDLLPYAFTDFST